MDIVTFQVGKSSKRGECVVCSLMIGRSRQVRFDSEKTRGMIGPQTLDKVDRSGLLESKRMGNVVRSLASGWGDTLG